jgi:hypothetical protein
MNEGLEIIIISGIVTIVMIGVLFYIGLHL